MGTASLAEAVILQAIGDLFDRNHRKESVRFLTGEGFRLASDIARISPGDRVEILTIFGGLYVSKRGNPGLKKAVAGN